MFEKSPYKFGIGETVRHIAAAEWEAEDQKNEKTKDLLGRWGMQSEQRWFIVERHQQECPGGVQKHYTCRGVSQGGGVTKEYFRFNEVELSKLKGK